MSKIQTCLWFDGQAEEAATFYTSLFKNSKVGSVARYGEAGAQVSGRAAGSAMTVEFELEGLSCLGLNGGPMFQFTPAVSFFVSSQSESEIDALWAKLKGGKVYWDLKKYPWSEKYGWCEDRYGVSWQIMLTSEVRQKIAPAFLFSGKRFGQGEEAIQFYASVFKDSTIETLHKDPTTGSVMHAAFSLRGTPFVLMEGAEGDFEPSIAMSFIVGCDAQDDIDYFWKELGLKGGEPGRCGWLKDRYGLSWQIIPTVLGRLMTSGDPKRTENVMKQMLTMTKLDIATLSAAAE